MPSVMIGVRGPDLAYEVLRPGLLGLPELHFYSKGLVASENGAQAGP